MQQLLIPTDFSKNAWNATQYALQFFKNENITFHFLHIDTSITEGKSNYLYSGDTAFLKNVPAHLEAKMDSWMQKINTQFNNPKHQFKTQIIQKRFIDGIRGEILKNNINFMVMGSKGTSGVKQKVLGSKTTAVMTRVQCSILIVPEKASYKKPKIIGFPTDFNMDYSGKVTNTLIDISNVCKARVKVLRVSKTNRLANFQNDNKALLQVLLGSVSHSFHVVENSDLNAGLQSFVTTMQIDVLAIIAKNLNFFQRLFFNPKAVQSKYLLNNPFLVLHG